MCVRRWMKRFIALGGTIPGSVSPRGYAEHQAGEGPSWSIPSRLWAEVWASLPQKDENPCRARASGFDLAERGGSSQPDPKSLILLQDANQERVLFCVPTL